LHALLILAYFCLALAEAQKANGKKCFRSSRCNSGHCCKIPGKIFKQCQECCTNDDCPNANEVCSGFNCKDVGSVDPGTPSSNKPNGERCGGDGECASSHCCGFLWKRCRECCNNRDCPTGVCKNNVCYKELSFGARCKSNNDLCADPLKCCKTGWWTTRCQNCCGKWDCTDPNKPFCVSGVCSDKAPAGESCANNPCQSGLTCCPSNQICNQCCNVGFSTECGNVLFNYCSLGNVCSPKRQAGSLCAEDYECLSNQCVNGGGGFLGNCA